MRCPYLVSMYGVTMLDMVKPPHQWAKTAMIGSALTNHGFDGFGVAAALGIPPLHKGGLDHAIWRCANQDEGDLGTLIDLLILGEVKPRATVDALLPPEAWEVGLIREERPMLPGMGGVAGMGVSADGMVLPLGTDLCWTDRPERSLEGKHGIFVPDGSSLAVRHALGSTWVTRHLDMGCGAGAVTVAAARTAEHTLAVDINLSLIHI